MCDFNNLTQEQKDAYHLELTRCAESMGGKKNFFELLETIRKSRPHALIAASAKSHFPLGTIEWGKVIFQDKLTLLLQERINESKRGNLLPNTDAKNYKKVLNLVRTLSPIAFEIKPKEEGAFEGFTMHAFQTVDANTTLLNPLFDAVFFCAMETVKKILNHTPKES